MTVYANATDTMQSATAELFAAFEQWKRQQNPQTDRIIENVELGLTLVRAKEIVTQAAVDEFDNANPEPDESDRSAWCRWVEDGYYAEKNAWPKWVSDNLAPKFEADDALYAKTDVIRWAHNRMFEALKCIGRSVGDVRVVDVREAALAE